jgi:hypothetical protein|tara:strand:+ start:1455 stop:3287 length:1833 start_codon:yes stop_codon:yes gene_type:complete
MAKVGDYTISDIYQGGYSSLTPSYGNVFTGYRVAADELGMITDPRTANQIQALGQTLNQGVIPVEVGVLSPEVFDQIPKQHFKEINRMAKLAGAKTSLHAPLIEPSGIDAEGRRPWDESYRELAEKQLNDVVERAVEMDDKGGMPITIHSSGIPGKEYKMTSEGKKVERLIVINQETGKMAPVEEETKFYPQLEKLKEIKTPEKQLKVLNDSEWGHSFSPAVFSKENADKILDQVYDVVKDLLPAYNFDPKFRDNLTQDQRDIFSRVSTAQEYLKESEMTANALFSKAYKYGTEKDQENLKKLAKNYRDASGIKYEDEIKKMSEKQQIHYYLKTKDPKNKSRAISMLLEGLQDIQPNLYIPIEDFAVKKSAQTFANVAFNAFDKHKNKAPIISVENMFPGMAFSSGDEMNKLILESKKKFVEKAVGKGYSKSTAEKQADKLIGVTLDVGHLNIARKKGFKDKDLLKEVEQITKHVKHIHMTDNFGYSDSHLPPGMGNVPIKKILETLEKKGVDLKKVRKINEVGGWFEHFKTSPYEAVLGAFGSPMTSAGQGPYWNQAIGLEQSYFGGYGQMLPNINYETFGAGFSQLPAELGGQRPGGAGGRMSGRPME